MTTLTLDIVDSRPVAARCDDTHLHVTLADGRELATPLWWYPRLLKGSAPERAAIELMPMGIHWPDLDEDISVDAIVRGRPSAEAPGSLQRWRSARRRRHG
jgi:hypothetical protein